MSLFPVYLFILLVFMNRYLLGLYLRLVRGRRFDRTVEGYEPTATIVVPLYNEGRSIYDTILRFSELDYPKDKLTVIVVDDCSSDDTVERARRAAAADPRVRVVVNERNLGDYPNRNRAAALARGRFLKYHDSDDVMYPHCLSTMMTALIVLKLSIRSPSGSSSTALRCSHSR